MSDSEYLFNFVVVGIHVMKVYASRRRIFLLGPVLTEAEGRREPTQHGVLQCQAGGEGGCTARHVILYRLP